MSTTTRYFPDRDDQLQGWLENFVTVAAANEGALGLSPSVVAALADAQTDYSTALANHVHAMALARASTQTKDAQRTATKALFAEIVRQVQITPSVTDSLRAELGITIRKPPVRQTPKRPENLTGMVQPSGQSVKLKWSANGNTYPTIYRVEQKIGATGEWTQVELCTAAKCVVALPAAAQVSYRVIAQRNGLASEPCFSLQIIGGEAPPLALAA